MQFTGTSRFQCPYPRFHPSQARCLCPASKALPSCSRQIESIYTTPRLCCPHMVKQRSGYTTDCLNREVGYSPYILRNTYRWDLGIPSDRIGESLPFCSPRSCFLPALSSWFEQGTYVFNRRLGTESLTLFLFLFELPRPHTRCCLPLPTGY